MSDQNSHFRQNSAGGYRSPASGTICLTTEELAHQRKLYERYGRIAKLSDAKRAKTRTDRRRRLTRFLVLVLVLASLWAIYGLTGGAQ